MAAQDIVMRHYRGNGGLGDHIDAQLQSLGFEERNPLSPKDTAAVDQFHVGGFARLRAIGSARRCSAS